MNTIIKDHSHSSQLQKNAHTSSLECSSSHTMFIVIIFSSLLYVKCPFIIKLYTKRLVNITDPLVNVFKVMIRKLKKPGI